MILIQVYSMMGHTVVEAQMTGDGGSLIGKTSEWADPDVIESVEDLCNHITKALRGLDAYAGDLLDGVCDEVG